MFALFVILAAASPMYVLRSQKDVLNGPAMDDDNRLQINSGGGRDQVFDPAAFERHFSLYQ